MAALVNRVTSLVPKLALRKFKKIRSNEMNSILLAVARYGQSKLSRFWYFARVELRPPMPSEFGQVQQGVQRIIKSASTGAWRQLTVKVRSYY